MTVIRDLEDVLEAIQIEMSNFTWEDGEKPKAPYFDLYHIEKDLASVTRRVERYKSRYRSGI